MAQIIAAVPKSTEAINPNGFNIWCVTIFKCSEHHCRIVIFDNENHKLPYTYGFCSGMFEILPNHIVHAYGNRAFNKYINKDGGFFMVPSSQSCKIGQIEIESCDTVLKVDDKFVDLMNHHVRAPFDDLLNVLVHDMTLGRDKSQLIGCDIWVLKTENAWSCSKFVIESRHPYTHV